MREKAYLIYQGAVTIAAGRARAAESEQETARVAIAIAEAVYNQTIGQIQAPEAFGMEPAAADTAHVVAMAEQRAMAEQMKSEPVKADGQ